MATGVPGRPAPSGAFDAPPYEILNQARAEQPPEPVDAPRAGDHRRRAGDVDLDVENAARRVGRRDVAPGNGHSELLAVAEIDAPGLIGERGRDDASILAHLAALRQSFDRGLRRSGREARARIKPQR